ncbi:hypothetical protein PGB90_003759 [Kerria lacca]
MKLVCRIRGDRGQKSLAEEPANHSSCSSPIIASAMANSTRDRSRSLCVEQLGLATLMHPAFEPATRNLRNIYGVGVQRRRASSAV